MCWLLLACGCSGADDARAKSDASTPTAGTKAPGDLPNLSTAGTQSSAGAGGATGSEQCRFLELNDCVSSALDEIVNCLSAGRVGMFNADRTSCQFGEADAVATFSKPVRPEVNHGIRPNFELRVGSEVCATFSDGDAESPYLDRYSLVTKGHNVEYLLGYERKLTCDGTSREFNGMDVTACADANRPFVPPSPYITDNVKSVIFEFARSGFYSRVFMCNDQ